MLRHPISLSNFGFCAVLLSSPVALAQSAEKGEDVRFGIMELAPYGFYSDDGNVSGYLYEAANLILEEAGYPKVNKVLPVRRLFRNMDANKQDCSILAGTDFVKEKFQLIEKIGKKLIAGILPLKGIELNSYKDLYAYKIVVPRGIKLATRFDNDEKIIKVHTKGYFQSVKMIVNGRAEAIAGAFDSLFYNARRQKLVPSQVFGKPLAFKNLDLWLVCAPNRLKRTTIERLRNAVIALRENGHLQEIIDRYL